MANFDPNDYMKKWFTEKTAAPKTLTDLKIEDLFTNKIDDYMLLTRCWETFYASTLGYKGRDDIYGNMFQIYHSEMIKFLRDVFKGLSKHQFDSMVEKAEENINTNARIRINVGVVRHTGIEEKYLQVSNVNFTLNDEMKRQNLDFTEKPQSFNLAANVWKDLRVSDLTLKITFRLLGVGYHDQYIRYDEISCRGFNDWIHFEFTESGVDYNIGLLVKISFSLEIESLNFDSQQCHLNLVKAFLEYKLNVYRNKGEVFIPHTIGTQVQLDDTVGNILFWSDLAYWTRSAHLKHEIETQKKGLIRQRLSDFHLKDNFFDFVENKSVCLCNEWCNLEAFMRYNPVMQFILYQHNQLFVNRKKQIPIYYLMVICNILRDDKAQQQATPVYNLLESIHTVVVEQYRRIISDPSFKNYFNNPNTKAIIGSIYMCLRKKLGLSLFKTSRAIDRDVFSDCILENIRIYYTVLNGLHYIITDLFIDRQKQSEFRKELGQYSRCYYILVLIENLKDISYTSTWESNLFSTDFTPEVKYDYEQDIEQVLEKINRVNSIEANPLNVCLFANKLISFVISYSKFIAKVLPYIRHRSETDYTFESNQLIYLDSELNKKLKPVMTNPNALDFNIFITNSPIHKLYLYLYLTLMLYGIQFPIKVYNITVMRKYCLTFKPPYNIPARDLTFIFKGDWVERSLTYTCRQLLTIPNDDRDVYESGNQMPSQAITRFYNTFWRKLDHENGALFIFEASKSLLLQHGRVYFFQRHNGFQTNIFRNIIVQIRRRIKNIGLKSDFILEHRILPVLSKMVWMRDNVETDFEAKPEVLDVLAFWLCRAEASVLINSVANILKSLHDLEDQRIVDHSTHYTLSKPGFVHIFVTMNVFLNRIHEMKTYYMNYDEFDRISAVLDETIIAIRDLYKCSYQKFARDWTDEILLFTNDTHIRIVNDYNIMSSAICLHIMNGYLFYYYIGLSHRNSLRYIKYNLSDILIRIDMIQLPDRRPYHEHIHTILTGSCVRYARDMVSLRQKTPFQFPYFYYNCIEVFNRLSNELLTPPASFDLDMDLANTPIN